MDIVRDALTGKLYVIEANASGDTWSLSSPTGLSIQKRGGFDLKAQFNALQRAARLLVDQTRRLAC